MNDEELCDGIQCRSNDAQSGDCVFKNIDVWGKISFLC